MAGVIEAVSRWRQREADVRTDRQIRKSEVTAVQIKLPVPMTTQPTMWNRFCAKMQGEVSADTLEAYRRASLAVYDVLAHAETHREGAKSDGKNA